MEKINIVLVVPPVSLLQSPSLGVHILQSCAKNEGFNVSVFYADQLFALKIGLETYDLLNEKLMSPYEQIAERLFAKIAYGEDMPHLGKRTTEYGINYKLNKSDLTIEKTDWVSLSNLENKILEWVGEVTDLLLDMNPDIVGFTTSHQQTNAAVALINNLKSKNSNILTLIGGSNCDGKMADGIASLSTNIDLVFKGESELSFINFLQQFHSDPSHKFPKIIEPVKIKRLDDIPTPYFEDYFKQLNDNGLEHIKELVWINYETSRGCWWGVKNLCTFCGVNGSNSNFRLKKAEKIISDLELYTKRYKVKNIRMVDTLMPGSYFRNFLPKVRDTLNINVFYEMRADISLEQMKLLKDSGVNFMQIGIEAFSTDLLNMLNKGIKAYENINALRFAKIVGCTIGWNLLREIPEDRVEHWEELLQILPNLRHFDPPSNFRPVELARFSPYYEKPNLYSISNITHFNVYDDIFPSHSDITNLAWLFTGDFDCYSKFNSQVILDIDKEITIWNKLWQVDKENVPTLEIIELDNSRKFLIDTREIKNSNKKIQNLSNAQASICLLGAESKYFEEFKDWAVQNNFIIKIDNLYIPLVTASYHLIQKTKENEK